MTGASIATEPGDFDPRAEPKREGLKDERLVIQVAEQHRRLGSFTEWLGAAPATRLGQLRAVARSKTNPRTAVRACKILLWALGEHHAEVLAGLSDEEAAAIDREAEEWENLSHSTKRARRWRDGETARQERDARRAGAGPFPNPRTST